jgi:hypothetical protein
MARLLYDRVNPATLSRTRITIDEETGLPLIVKRQELGPVLEAAKRAARRFDPAAVRRNPGKVRHVATIPTVIMLQLKALGIWQDRRALMRWLSDPDNRVFRTDDGSRLA